MKNKYIVSTQKLMLFFAVFSLNAFAQVNSDIIVSDESNCEQMASYLDTLMTDANSYPGSSIILVARLGDGEKSRKYNQRRLKVVKDGISAFDRYPAERIIMTEGERVQGKGQVEAYIGGRLFAVFKAGRKKNLKDRTSKECAA